MTKKPTTWEGVIAQAISPKPPTASETDLRNAAQQLLETWDATKPGVHSFALIGAFHGLRAALARPAPDATTAGASSGRKILDGLNDALAFEKGDASRGRLRSISIERPAALHVVLDGPPGPEGGRFVEVETPDGKSVCAGSWHDRTDGLVELRIPAHVLATAPASAADAEGLRDERSEIQVMADGLAFMDAHAEASEAADVDFFAELRRRNSANVEHIRNLQCIGRRQDAEGICRKAVDAAITALSEQYTTPTPAVPTTRVAGLDREAVARTAFIRIVARSLGSLGEAEGAWASGLFQDDRKVAYDIANALAHQSPAPAGDAVEAVREALEALTTVNRLVSEASQTGFNYTDGDWPDALFYSQQATSRAIKKARAALAAIAQGPGAGQAWQPIETAPRDGSYVMGYGAHETRGTYIDVVHFWSGRWTIEWMHGYGTPSHWMPLPAAPATAASEVAK